MTGGASPIRVLVVEDSLTIRRAIVEGLEATPGFEVVGEAGDGRAAIELCQRLRPDVITMDMMMPIMTGLAATEQIMAFCPTPILVVSASTNRGDLFNTYDALAAGAVDVLDKPGAADDDWVTRLAGALRVTSRVRVITHPRARLEAAQARSGASRREPGGGPGLVAIGASTGGPGAITQILRALPETFALPTIVVLHIAEPFGVALAEWLALQIRAPVRHPEDGEPLPAPGRFQVLLAPPGSHLVVERGRLRRSSGPERWSCRPSVDVLFESLVDRAPATAACLLTGMGRDGAAGLLALRRAGATTIAQDEATSVVFGMPGEAVRLGAAAHVLPLGEIGPMLGRLAPGGRHG